MRRIILFSCHTAKFSLVLAVISSLQSLAAEDPSLPQTKILQARIQQVDFREHTAQIVAKIQSMISDLEANGITGDDVKVLEATKAVLSNLSEKEMNRVIDSLKMANGATNLDDAKKGVVQAYNIQQKIVLEFRQILQDYQERQAEAELPIRFMDLSRRQGATFQTTSEIADNMIGKSMSALSATQQTLVEVLQSDQEGLSGEVALAVEELTKVAGRASSDSKGKRIQSALKAAKDGNVQQVVDQASEEIKGGMLLKATYDQKIARDQLRQIALMFKPQNQVQIIQNQLAELNDLIGKQKQLMDQSRSAINSTPPVADLDTTQGALVDEADTVQKDMVAMSSTASDLVKQAEDPMQNSRLNLARRKDDAIEKAIEFQQVALDKLQQAEGALTNQLAGAQKAQDEYNKDALAKLQDLQQQIQAKQKEEQQLAQQTKQALDATTPDPQAVSQAQQQQTQVQEETSSLQQTSQAISIGAAQALADAAQDMQTAQNNLSNPAKQQDALPDQQAAQEALNQASAQVQQELNARQQDQPAAPEALTFTSDALQKAQTDVANNAFDNANRDLQTAANTPNLPASAQTALKNAREDVAQQQQEKAEQDIAQAQADITLAIAGIQPHDTPTATSASTEKDQKDQSHFSGSPASTTISKDAGNPELANPNHKLVSGKGKFVSLAARDREVIQQSQTERRPQEYAADIDQYMKNLADEASANEQ